MPNQFPWRKEPWVECFVCGFEYPLSATVLNYKSHRYVDIKCDDQLSHGDILEYWDMPRELIQISPQPVPDQGAVDESVGAGEGGAGEGPAGGGGPQPPDEGGAGSGGAGSGGAGV